MSFKDNKIAYLLFGLLFIYLLLRAYFVPFVSDEAGTFFFFIQNGKFIPPDVHWDANNHLLNSALSYLTYLAFGPSPFALRLPNVLLFALYFYYVLKISKHFSNPWLRWTFLITLVFAHNFIEFFALDRGYGMSMSLLMPAIWYLMQTLRNKHLSDLFASSLFITLATLANLTLINTSILFVSIFFLFIFKYYDPTKKSSTFKALGIVFLFNIIPMAVMIRLLFEYKERNLLYYGTLDGFWDLSVTSLIKLLAESENFLFPFFIILFFIFILITSLYKIFKEKALPYLLKAENVFSIFFWGNLLAVFILGYLLDINFPEDRTGMYFFPFFIGTILFSLNTFTSSIPKKLLPFILSPLLFFPLHFILNANLSHTTLWKDENIPARFQAYVEAESLKNNTNYTIGGYRMRILTWAYINYLHGGSLNQVQGSHHPEYISDIQIVKMKPEEKWEEFYTRIDHDPHSELSLLKRKEILSYDEILNIHEDPVQNSSVKYYRVYQGKIDSIGGGSLLIQTRFKIRSTAKPLVMWLVAEVKNKQKEKRAYEMVSLEWKKKQWIAGEDQFESSILLYDLEADSELLKIYLWNINGVAFELEDLECSINKIVE